MSLVTIGVDCHKRNHAAVGLDAVGVVVGCVEVSGGFDGIGVLLDWARQFPQRRWAVEDCRLVTAHLEEALIDAEEVAVRVPPHMTGPSRRSQRTTGKSDLIDAEAVARAALAARDLPTVTRPSARVGDLGLWVGYRDQAVQARTELINRLRWDLHQLDPTWSPTDLTSLTQLSATAERLALSETVAGVAQKVTERIAVLTRDINQVTVHIGNQVRMLAPQLVAIEGCGNITAATILTRIGDISRFKTEAQFGRYCGVAPIPAASGATTGKTRLHRGGDRHLNHAIHIIALTQSRYYPPAGEFLAKKRAAGKTTRDATRALKRHITRRIYNTVQTLTPTT